MDMTSEEVEQVQAHIREIAAILYRNTPGSELTNLETIEKSVRQQVLEHISPNIALFLPLQVTGVGVQRGKTRQLKSCVGVLKLKTEQTRAIGSESSHSAESVAREVLLTSVGQRILPECRSRN